MTERDRERRRIAVLSIPFVLLALFGAIIPLWEMAKISVSESQFVTEGFTLEQYETLWASGSAFVVGGLLETPLAPVFEALGWQQPTTDPKYGEFAWNSLWFSAVTTAVSVVLGVAIAHGLERYDLPAEGLLVTLISFPISLPGIVAAFMIIVLLGNTGLLTNLVLELGRSTPVVSEFVGDLRRTDVALATTVTGLFFAYLYSMIPRATFLLRGTYAEVNRDAEEAARVLGASPGRTFYHVTLPQIRPGVVGACILTFRTALAIFGTVLVLKSLSVVTLRISREISVGFNIQMASAMALVFFVFTLLFTFVGLRFTSAEVGPS